MNYGRKRIYDLLENLFIDNNSNFLVEDFLKNNNNEVKELIWLLTNNNPFISLSNVKISYQQIIAENENMMGAYENGNHSIVLSVPFIEAIIKNPKDIGMLLDTIYHEQRHNDQDYAYQYQQEVINNVNMKEIYTSMFESPLSQEELQELNNFASKHDLLKVKVSEGKLRKLEFGAYWSNKAEIDARNNAYNNTIKTFEIIINDPNCPKKLKTKLKRSLKFYKDTRKNIDKENEASLKSFEKLERKTKKVLFKVIRSENDLDNETYSQLLNGVLLQITQHLTLDENLEIAGWAIKNHYINLIDRIDISKSLSAQQKDIDKFLLKITNQNLVDSCNFEKIANLFAPLKQNKQKEVMKQMVDYQAEMRKPLVLLDNLIMGKAGADCIAPIHISTAVSNYINYADHTTTIDNSEEFDDIKHKLNMLIYQTSILSEDEKEDLSKLYDRFDKVKAKAKIDKVLTEIEVGV